MSESMEQQKDFAGEQEVVNRKPIFEISLTAIKREGTEPQSCPGKAYLIEVLSQQARFMPSL